MKHSLLALILFAMSASGGATEVFVTTGAAGEPEYTDKPVADARRIEVWIARPSPAPAPENQQAPAFEELSPCEQARHIVARYESAEVLAERGDDGAMRILDAEEAAAMIDKARADVARLCKESSDD